AYHEWLEAKSSYGEDTRKWCRRLGLEEQRFYEMTKLRSQFKHLLQEVGLMESEVEVMDSVARIQRHGEMKQLRDLRRQLQKAPRKKRILHVGHRGDEDEEGEEIDIKDVEFRLQQDPALVQYDESMQREICFYFLLAETLSSEDKKEPSPRTRNMQKQLRQRYDAVLKTEIPYTVKRLLPADVKHLYTGAQAFRALAQDNEGCLAEDRFQVNPRKGGVFLSSYFTFGCLEEMSLPEEMLMNKTCRCPLCDEELPLGVMDAVLHLDTCDKDSEIIKGASAEPEEAEQPHDPLKKAYFCKDCNRELRLTLPEIFQHKKTHQSTSQGKELTFHDREFR
ncbi:hypothetical protein V5799_028882, partial [Amblyomma americanum]